MKSINSKDSVEDILILQGHKSFNKHRTFYTLLLILCLGLFFAIPWVQIESIATSPAVVLPRQGPTQVRAKTSGEIDLFGPAEDRFVFQGDTLFILRSKVAAENHVVLSPTDGYVRDLSGCDGVCPVVEGQVVMEILPEPNPIVKCYLTGGQINSIKADQKVQFQLQSSQNQINRILEGNVKAISPSQAHRNNDKKNVYEVLCSIDINKGKERSLKMKTGMTLIARFRLARRSAFDILMKDPGSVETDPS